jgi:hypothetical protein
MTGRQLSGVVILIAGLGMGAGLLANLNGDALTCVMFGLGFAVFGIVGTGLMIGITREDLKLRH